MNHCFALTFMSMFFHFVYFLGVLFKPETYERPLTPGGAAFNVATCAIGAGAPSLNACRMFFSRLSSPTTGQSTSLAT